MKKATSLIIIGLLLGGWMIIDGLYTIINGFYIGGESPGPWAEILKAVGIDPFSFAPGFLALGMLWVIAVMTIVVRHPWWRAFIGSAAVLTLWYLPFGTFLSLVSLTLVLSDIMPRKFQKTFISVVAIIASALITGYLTYLIGDTSA